MSGRNGTMGEEEEGERGGVAVTHSGGDDKAFCLLSQPLKIAAGALQKK